jgi:hypothetical protein
MWGFSLSVWDKVSLSTLIVGMFCGALAVVLTGFSSIVSLRTSSIAQENAHKETVAAQIEGQRAGEAAARANERAVKLEAEAENAKARIAVAQKEAAEATARAAEANERAAKLEVEAEDAKARIAVAQKETAEATARAAEANGRAQNLRRQQLPRSPNIPVMTDILKKSIGTVEILYFIGDWDSTLLSKALEAVLLDSGWKVSSVTPLSAEELSKGRNTIGWWGLESKSFPKEGLISGAQIGMGSAPETVPDRSPISILAGALYRGLGAPGIMTSLVTNPSLPDGYFRLVILPRSAE